MNVAELVRRYLADHVSLAAETAAILVVAYGTLEALVRAGSSLHRGAPALRWRKSVWIQLGSWLLLSLQFALAADIARTAISPSWHEIGQLAAIAAIRTLLGLFLERDLVEAERGT